MKKNQQQTNKKPTRRYLILEMDQTLVLAKYSVIKQAFPSGYF